MSIGDFPIAVDHVPCHCDCGVGEAGPGEMRKHLHGCDLFRTDTDEWRASHKAMRAAQIEYRTFSIDYTGGQLDDDAFDALHDAIVDVFIGHGRKVEGSSDGPLIWTIS